VWIVRNNFRAEDQSLIHFGEFGSDAIRIGLGNTRGLQRGT
jgi:hypothetical protein